MSAKNASARALRGFARPGTSKHNASAARQKAPGATPICE